MAMPGRRELTVLEVAYLVQEWWVNHGEVNLALERLNPIRRVVQVPLVEITPSHDAEPVVKLEQLDAGVLWLGVGEAHVAGRGGQERDGGGRRDQGRDHVR